MKKLSYKIQVLFTLLVLASFTQLQAQEETKSIRKSFDIKRDTKIEINNKYGNVIINRWEKNVFDLKVDIEARGSTSAKTQKISRSLFGRDRHRSRDHCASLFQ